MRVDTGLLRERAFQYWLLMRFNRPIGIFLLLWPALWALWLAAEGWPNGWVLTVFIAGVVLMRAAGCVVNDFADRDLDPLVRRTRNRPLATGTVSSREAWILFAVLCLVAFLLVLTLGKDVVLMSFAGAFLAVTYPFVKRVSYLPQVYLGMAFGWAVPMAFVAQSGEAGVICWLLFIATVLWATVYDTMYAMVDRKDDLKAGIKSTAILFGESDRLLIGIIQGLFFFVLYLIGKRLDMGAWFYAGLVAAFCLSVYQQYLIRHREENGCFRAFLNNNWVGASVFCGIVLHYGLK